LEIGNRKALSDEILSDARKKAERAAKRAERDAAGILAAAGKEAEAAAERVVATARRRAERQARSLLATVEQEVRRDLLESQEAELDRLFRAALDRAGQPQGADAAAMLAALAAEGVAALRSREIVLGFAPGGAGVATEAWLAEVRRRAGRDDATIRVSPTPEPIQGGVVGRSADGRQVYDNSFAARLERLRPALRRQLAARLYPAASRGGEETPGRVMKGPEKQP
jgi:V/A-type H+/Na+-transporting ATPase subunit E